MDLVSGAMTAVVGGSGGLAIIGGIVAIKWLYLREKGGKTLCIQRPYDRQHLIVSMRVSQNMIPNEVRNGMAICQP